MALTAGGLAWWRKRSGFVYWFGLVLLCYQLHIVLDFFTVGRGVMLFWPLSVVRFSSPIKLFYGLHWSEGFISIQHIWTLLNELGFTVLLVWAVHYLERKIGFSKRTSSPLKQSLQAGVGRSSEMRNK
jgi:hypothetical protein